MQDTISTAVTVAKATTTTLTITPTTADSTPLTLPRQPPVVAIAPPLAPPAPAPATPPTNKHTLVPDSQTDPKPQETSSQQREDRVPDSQDEREELDQGEEGRAAPGKNVGPVVIETPTATQVNPIAKQDTEQVYEDLDDDEADYEDATPYPADHVSTAAKHTRDEFPSIVHQAERHSHARHVLSEAHQHDYRYNEGQDFADDSQYGRGPSPGAVISEGALMVYSQPQHYRQHAADYPPDRYTDKRHALQQHWIINSRATDLADYDHPLRAGHDGMAYPEVIEEPASPYQAHAGQVTARGDVVRGQQHFYRQQDSEYDVEYRPSEDKARPSAHATSVLNATEKARGQFRAPNQATSSTSAHDTPTGNNLTNATRATSAALPHGNNEAVAEEMVGGRRVLVRRAGTKRDFLESHIDDDELYGDRISEPKRARGNAAEANEEDDEVQIFDPTAEIIKFDTQKQLVEEWNRIQKDTIPVLQEFANQTIAHAYDTVTQVIELFYQLNEDARMELEEGVRHIADEESQQRQYRETIVNWSNYLKKSAGMLAAFQSPSARASLGPSAGHPAHKGGIGNGNGNGTAHGKRIADGRATTQG